MQATWLNTATTRAEPTGPTFALQTDTRIPTTSSTGALETKWTALGRSATLMQLTTEKKPLKQ